jgi:hypothetical protein
MSLMTVGRIAGVKQFGGQRLRSPVPRHLRPHFAPGPAALVPDRVAVSANHCGRVAHAGDRGRLSTILGLAAGQCEDSMDPPVRGRVSLRSCHRRRVTVLLVAARYEAVAALISRHLVAPCGTVLVARTTPLAVASR